MEQGSTIKVVLPAFFAPPLRKCTVVVNLSEKSKNQGTDFKA